MEQEDKGYTNTIMMDGDRVRKIFPDWSVVGIGFTQFHLLRGREIRHKAAYGRMENEKRGREVLDEHDIAYADILEEDMDGITGEEAKDLPRKARGQPYMEFERLDGPDMLEYVRDMDDPDEIYDFVRGAADELRTLHDEGCGLYDAQWENVIVEDGERQYIDLEFFDDDAPDYVRTADVKQFLTSPSTLDPEKQDVVISAFEDGYGRDASAIERASAGIRGTVGAATYYRDTDKLRNAAQNTVGNLYDRLVETKDRMLTKEY